TIEKSELRKVMVTLRQARVNGLGWSPLQQPFVLSLSKHETASAARDGTGESLMAEPSLYFKQIEIGPMQNFAYLIGDPATREVLVVDAAWDIPAIVRLAEQDGFAITKALVTHYHQDHLGGDFSGYHIQGAAELLEQVKAKVYIHKAEAPFLARLA